MFKIIYFPKRKIVEKLEGFKMVMKILAMY